MHTSFRRSSSLGFAVVHIRVVWPCKTLDAEDRLLLLRPVGNEVPIGDDVEHCGSDVGNGYDGQDAFCDVHVFSSPLTRHFPARLKTHIVCMSSA